MISNYSGFSRKFLNTSVQKRRYKYFGMRKMLVVKGWEAVLSVHTRSEQFHWWNCFSYEKCRVKILLIFYFERADQFYCWSFVSALLSILPRADHNTPRMPICYISHPFVYFDMNVVLLEANGLLFSLALISNTCCWRTVVTNNILGFIVSRSLLGCTGL